VLSQVKAAMVDSANDSISSLRTTLGVARQDALKASARAQEACAVAAQREGARYAADLHCAMPVV
jgi:hypothetical protein